MFVTLYSRNPVVVWRGRSPRRVETERGGDAYDCDPAIRGLRDGVMAEGMRRWIFLDLVGDRAPAWRLHLDVIYRVRNTAPMGTIRFGGPARRRLIDGRLGPSENKLFFSGMVERLFDERDGEFFGWIACEAYLCALARRSRADTSDR
jgi:hypothetical protein